MKKILTIILMLCPFVSFADDLDGVKIQMLDSEIEKFTKIRDEKYAALKQCEKNTKGFKIAGITTLIATGVGVGVDVKLAKDLDKAEAEAEARKQALKKAAEETQSTDQEEETQQQEPTATNNCDLASVVNESGKNLGFWDFEGAEGGTDEYGLTQKGTWATEFSWGIVKGEAMCSNTSGTYAKTGSPDMSSSQTNNKYCWCKMDNNYTMNGQSCTVASPAWVFYNGSDPASICAKDCAYYCADRVQNLSDFRAALFGVQ